jgi:hypothetical protein
MISDILTYLCDMYIQIHSTYSFLLQVMYEVFHNWEIPSHSRTYQRCKTLYIYIHTVSQIILLINNIFIYFLVSYTTIFCVYIMKFNQISYNVQMVICSCKGKRSSSIDIRFIHIPIIIFHQTSQCLYHRMLVYLHKCT